MKIRITAAFIIAVMLAAGSFPFTPFTAEAMLLEKDKGGEGLQVFDPGADEVTPLPGAGELADGEVWADKSVEYEQDGVFEITLRAFGKRYAMELAEYRALYKPINAVFVLDTSSSMSYNSLKGKMNAVTAAGKMILNANPRNRVAVVFFDRSARLAGGSEFGYFTGNADAATSASGSSVWNSLKTLKTTWLWAQKAADLDELIVYAGNNQLVPKTTSATNIVSGLNLAYALLKGGGEFPEAPNKEEPSPIIILMTDGAPNYYSTGGSYTNSTAGSSSPGAAGDEKSAAETIKRAAEIAATQTNADPSSRIKIYTVGYNVESNNIAWITLNPKNSHDKLLDTQTKMHVTGVPTAGGVSFSCGDKTVAIAEGITDVDYYRYNTHYYAPLFPQDLITAFTEIVSDVTFDPASPLDNDTSLVITDVIGEGFELIPESLPAGGYIIKYDPETKIITWTIPAGELYLIDPAGWGGAGDNPTVDPGKVNTLTFMVAATGAPVEGESDGSFYYTNSGAYSEFFPSPGNDNYTDKNKNAAYLPNKGWLHYESDDEPEETTTAAAGTTTAATSATAPTSAAIITSSITTAGETTTEPREYPAGSATDPTGAEGGAANTTAAAPTQPATSAPPANTSAPELPAAGTTPFEGGGAPDVSIPEDLIELDENGVPRAELPFAPSETTGDAATVPAPDWDETDPPPHEATISSAAGNTEIGSAPAENPKTGDFAEYWIYALMAAAAMAISLNLKKPEKL